MSKHTPGPWEVQFETNITGNRVDVGHKGSVATCGGLSSSHIDCHPESLANTRLILAAPEMYEQLKKLSEMREWEDSAEVLDAVCELFNPAHDLITEIEGGV